MTYEQRYFLHLIVCAIKCEQPNEPKADIDWKEVYKCVTEHSMFVAFYSSVQKLKNKPAPEVISKLRRIYSVTLNKYFSKEFIADEAINSISTKSISIIPLKGYYIKNYYPKKEFRYVSDLDIITDNTSLAVKALKNDGFSLIKDDEHHIVLAKNNFAVEVHKSLFVGKYKDFFAEPFLHSFKVSAEKPIYKMNDNYFYSFFIAHFAYHFINGGVGIRSICDLYLLNKNLKISDKSIIESCGLKKFEEVFSDFALKVFENNDYDEEIMNIILSSHTSGDADNDKKISVAKHGKSKSFIYKIFPPYEMLSHVYPIKNRFQVPFYWVKRVYDVIKTRKDNVSSLKSYLSVTNKDEETYSRVLLKLGIKDK